MPLAGSICTSATGSREHAGKGLGKRSGTTCNLNFNKNADEQKYSEHVAVPLDENNRLSCFSPEPESRERVGCYQPGGTPLTLGSKIIR